MTRWPGRAAAALLLCWYSLTMARGLLWFDTGELALVGAQFGLGHPPGQPVYTLLLGIFARLPGVDPLVGMNLFSALCAALCALPAAALLRRLVPDLSPVGRLLCLLAVGALAPVWDQATRIELYALATLLALIILAGAAARPTAATRWAGLGALVGLLIGVNPIFAIAAALGAGLFAAPHLKRSGALIGATGAAAVSAVGVGALGYLYAFAVRDATDRLVWGPLRTGADWLAYLGGRDYSQTAHAAWGKVPGHLLDWLSWLSGQGALPVVLVGLLGWGLQRDTRRGLVLLALPLLAGVAFTFTYGVYFPEVPDYNGYLNPALWLAVVGVGVLAARIHVAVAGVLLVATLVIGERPVWDRSRAGIDLPRRLATRLLADLPPRAVLIVQSDHLVFPLMYLQAVEGQRPDVVVFNAGFGASSWFWERLYRQHPDLPRISLAAPSTAARLHRFVRAAGRPVFAESVRWAGLLQARPCPRGQAFGLESACAEGADTPDVGEILTDASSDPITRRVIAAERQRRGEGLWLMGEAGAALAALADDATLPRPAALTVPARRMPLRAGGDPVLIGDPLLNRASGAAILRACGQPAAAEAWLSAAPR